MAAAPAWADGSNARFRLGQPQPINGWEGVVATPVSGVCRTVLPWTDLTATLNIGFGTHSNLQVYNGGALVDITPASGFTAGAVDGAGSAGYGTGQYGIGLFGLPSNTTYYALTWSLDTYGKNLIANPRGQGLFRWQNSLVTPAALVSQAPAVITYTVQVRDYVFALGCSQEVGGAFNPTLIRHSGQADITNWTSSLITSTASREYPLQGGGRIVAGRELRGSLLVWTDSSLFLGTYVGSINQVWRFDKVGDKCGLIGPGAAVVVGATAFWISPDRQFHSYSLGGAVNALPCPIRADFAENLAASQGDKIVASSIAEYNEVRFDYPDSRDGYENSRYVALSVEGPDAGSWYRGIMVRTAMVDAGPSAYPCGVDFSGHIFWHERGDSADGSPLAWFIRSADIELDPEQTILVKQAWPDIAEQAGPISMTLYSKYFPQGATTTYGPYVLSPQDDQTDFKAKGRFFAVQFAANSSPTKGRLGQVIFDAKPAGRK